ncbi:MAG: ATP-binding protein [Thermodesulfovibrionales bacterium]|nr:ATP-binding protein [Thermodesulfovibrionales bacterium]
MSHIIDFTVEGLAGRSKPFIHKMDRHTNVFFGLNGCGKTSLLKVLHSAMANDAALLARVPFTAASVTIYSINYKRTFVRTIEKKVSKEQEPTIEEEREIRIDERGMVQTAERRRRIMRWKTEPIVKGASTTSWHHQYLPTSRLLLGQNDVPPWFLMKPTERPSMSEEQIDLFFAESIKHLWVKYTSGLLSDVRKAQEAGLASILRAVLSPPKTAQRRSKSELETHQAYLRMRQFVSRQGSSELISSEEAFKARYDEDATLRRVVHDIDKTEQQIEEASAPKNRLEELVKSLLAEGKVVTFSDRSIDIKTTAGTDIGVSSLSSGEKHVLRLLVETLLAGESSIIIDEPELSLHIDWQKRLLEMMRTLSPKAQIILATHSPEVMADIPDKFIIKM